MEKFDASHSCEKCGSVTAASYAYHPAGLRRCPSEDEHMHRRCPQCGYEWAEEPLA